MVDLAFVRRWSCYYKLTDKRLSALRLDYFPIKNFPMGVSVGRGSPLFEDPSGQVITDLLKSYPCIVYNYIDSGPYVDIYDRLQIPIKSRIVTNSRAVMYELLDQTPAFFSLPSRRRLLRGRAPDRSSLQVRTLELKNCPIRTEYGWITRRGHSRTALENACIDLSRRRCAPEPHVNPACILQAGFYASCYAFSFFSAASAQAWKRSVRKSLSSSVASGSLWFSPPADADIALTSR